MIIRGTIDKFYFHPSKPRGTGIAVIMHETDNGLHPLKVRGPFYNGVQAGDAIQFNGQFSEEIYNGRTRDLFIFRSCRPEKPVTEVGIQFFLSKTLNWNKHAVSWKSIVEFVEKYGKQSLTHLLENPHALGDLSTSNTSKTQALRVAFSNVTAPLIANDLLSAIGVREPAILNVLEAFGRDALNVIMSDPYRLTKFNGFTFAKIDRLTQDILDLDENDLRRVRAVIEEVASFSECEGNTYTYVEPKLSTFSKFGISTQDLERFIRKTSKEDGSINFDFVNEEPIFQRKQSYLWEKSAAAMVGSLLRGEDFQKDQDHTDIARTVLNSDKYAHFDEIQQDAVFNASASKFSILTGGPGTGKSTVTEAIVEIAEAVNSGPILLMAPTGKAARRLKETTKKEATTVHNALGAKLCGEEKTYKFHRENKLPNGCFVIVDEASMLDAEIFSALMSAMPPSGKVLLVGDKHQLPSVGAGYVLGDLIQSGIETNELRKVYRSGNNSGIAKGARLLQSGKVPKMSNSLGNGVAAVAIPSVRIASELPEILKELCSLTGIDLHKDIAVLSPQAPGVGGTKELNESLHRAFNPNGKPVGQTFIGSMNEKIMIHVGDRVMLSENETELGVMNGDVGTLISSSGTGRAGSFKVKFDSGEEIAFPTTSIRKFLPAFAITNHKSQGSQYPAVVLVSCPEHEKMLERTLTYTGWTRAERYLIVVGDPKALERSVKVDNSNKRLTRLQEFARLSVPKIMKDITPPPPTEARQECFQNRPN
ncbi:ATP-dependent DNA helicase [Flexibacterium corallicola]|uniref:ATP-dependent DNA helicase n=1 Tax=Flexibacterium corallicola TaxID=3037259 RepID=UPI00286F6309|nr:AAA family ATPase [Pseudovibrio sp. M1P-2-3]